MVSLRFLSRWTLYGLAASLVLASSCHRHDHGHGRSHGDHSGHGHGHGHGHDGVSIAVTRYTARTELFVEYPPLVQGKSASMLAHLTVLGERFQAVRSGTLEVVFRHEGEVRRTWPAVSLLRTGIFKPTGKAPPAGTYDIELRLRSPQVNDTIVLRYVRVSATKKQAEKLAAHESDKEGPIGFTKEKQWTIPFANHKVSARSLRKSWLVPGKVQPLAQRWARLSAPVTGRVSWVHPELQEGAAVKRGQRLLRIEPRLFAQTDLPTLQQQAKQANARRKLARLNLQRLQRMAGDRAVASWQVAQAKARLEQRKAQWQAARARLSLFRRSRSLRRSQAHSFVLRAPLAGAVLDRSITLGQTVTAGQPLLQLADTRAMRIQASVSEARLDRVSQIRGGSVQVGTTWRNLGKPSGVGAQVVAATRTLPVWFRLEKPEPLRLGQYVSVQLHFAAQRVLAIPTSALLDEQGRDVVFVQRTGESFAKVPVDVGIRDGNWVEIRKGLKAGDRVVTKGAYLLLLSQVLKQGGVGHGHAH